MALGRRGIAQLSRKRALVTVAFCRFDPFATPPGMTAIERALLPFIGTNLNGSKGSTPPGRGSAVVSPGAKPPQARRRELRTLEPQLRPRSTIGRIGQAHSAL